MNNKRQSSGLQSCGSPEFGRQPGRANSHRRALRRGFTLVELLTVIVIIAVLVALLLPLMHSVRQQTQSLQCASNLRQIGAGILIYCGDSGNVLFPWRNDEQWLNSDHKTQIDAWTETAYWGVAYNQYAGVKKQCFNCPAATACDWTDYLTESDGYFKDGNIYTTYGFNGYGFPGAQYCIFNADDSCRNLRTFKNAARTVLVQDAYESMLDGNGDTFAENPPLYQWYPYSGLDTAWQSLRHGPNNTPFNPATPNTHCQNYANILFMDGHVGRAGFADQRDVRMYQGNW